MTQSDNPVEHATRQPHRSESDEAKVNVSLEYYQYPFMLIDTDLARQGYDAAAAHVVRRNFWSVVPPGDYAPGRGQELLKTYLQTIERELANIFSRQSIGYWLHLYRRIFPGPAGRDQSPVTTGIVRSVFEAAMQKYASLGRCDRVALSNEVGPDEVLNGLLMTSEMEVVRDALVAFPQLVLTRFGTSEMRDMYEAEKLAYEVWRSMAALRTTGKGAPLIVDVEDPYFYDGRSDELDQLVTIYDARQGESGLSATGTVSPSFFQQRPIQPGEHSGYIFVPTYNVSGMTSDIFEAWFAALGIKIHDPIHGRARFNFLWLPFNLRGYYFAHLPFAKGFESRHNIPLWWVLTGIAAFYSRVFYLWREDSFKVLRFWQRAYEGPYTREFVYREIELFLPLGIATLTGDQDEKRVRATAKEIDITKLLSFFELTASTRQHINSGLGGPHSLLLPFSDDRWFIDYAWANRFFYNLFFDVKVEDEKDFKGAALEKLVHRSASALPTGPCRAINGTKKQVDAAFAVGKALVIVECKAIWKSFGIERGDPEAIRYRTKEVVNRSLSEIDDKARWLARNPMGNNYDIKNFDSIIPVAVSPFVEFIPSLNSWYWLRKDTSRVMTPEELRKFTQTDLDDNEILNRVPIR